MIELALNDLRAINNKGNNEMKKIQNVLDYIDLFLFVVMLFIMIIPLVYFNPSLETIAYSFFCIVLVYLIIKVFITKNLASFFLSLFIFGIGYTGTEMTIQKRVDGINWDNFKLEHNCKIVSKGEGFWGKTGWLCDENITYYK